MSNQPHNDDAFDLQEFAAELEVLKLEEEVQQMAKRIVQHRTTLPSQISSTLSSLLASQRPVLPTCLVDEGAEPDSETGLSQETISMKNCTFFVLLPFVFNSWLEEWFAATYRVEQRRSRENTTSE